MEADGGTRHRIREALLDALAVVLPVDCAGCGRPDRVLCSACRRALVPRRVCRSVDGLRVWAALPYEGAVREVVLALKEQDRVDVARLLAPALVAAIREAGPVDRMIAVPSSARGRRRRGYDPVRLVARHAGVRLERGLVRSARRAAQKTLDRSDRARNAAGALRARRALHGLRVLIVDDVVTTGATLAEARRALQEAGADVVGAAAIASVSRHGALTGAPQEPPG